jgi:hypothetical protein
VGIRHVIEVEWIGGRNSGSDADLSIARSTKTLQNTSSNCTAMKSIHSGMEFFAAFAAKLGP